LAIASAKVAYVRYKEIFSSERFQAVARQSARRQRLLWASTSTKSHDYLDTKTWNRSSDRTPSIPYPWKPFKTEPLEAYETLLLDIMRGDPTLFMRSDQVEAAWEVISPILEVWKTITPTAFPNYQAGSWGPEVADTLIAQDGRSRIMPTFLQCQEKTAVCRVTLMPSS